MAFKGPYPTVFSGHTTGLLISATTFSGGVTNVGTIGPHGISVIGATLQSGGIVDTGIISGGIKIDSHSKIVGSGGPAISVHDTTTYSGGIVNSGAIAALLPPPESVTLPASSRVAPLPPLCPDRLMVPELPTAPLSVSRAPSSTATLAPLRTTGLMLVPPGSSGRW